MSFQLTQVPQSHRVPSQPWHRLGDGFPASTLLRLTDWKVRRKCRPSWIRNPSQILLATCLVYIIYRLKTCVIVIALHPLITHPSFSLLLFVLLLAPSTVPKTQGNTVGIILGTSIQANTGLILMLLDVLMKLETSRSQHLLKCPANPKNRLWLFSWSLRAVSAASAACQVPSQKTRQRVVS